MPTMNLSSRRKIKTRSRINCCQKKELYLEWPVVLLYLDEKACPCSKSEVFRGFGI
jgi:hypothetical protein